MAAFTVDSNEIADSKVAGTPMLANKLGARIRTYKATLPVAAYADAGKMLAAKLTKGNVLIGALINGSANAGAATVNVSVGTSASAEAYIAEKGLDEPGFYPVKTGSVNSDVDYDVYVHLDAALTVASTTDTVEVVLFVMSI